MPLLLLRRSTATSNLGASATGLVTTACAATRPDSPSSRAARGKGDGGLGGRTQIRAAPRLLRRPVDPVPDVGRVDEVLPQMGNVLKEDDLVAEHDVIEEDEVLVDLAHVADV